MRITDWDDAYANRAHVPAAAELIESWPVRAAAYRTARAGAARLDRAYGAGGRQRFDLFLPDGAAQGLVVFVHGGYWMAFGREDWSHLAAGACAHGWAVAIPSYTLAPQARIAEIGREVVRAITAAAADVAGPIRLVGHSAGGHLVTRAITHGSGLPAEVAARIAHVVSISGVHDLRPLLRTGMNATLALDPSEARAESPALLEPIDGARVTVWVGDAERPEFVRHTTLLANVWTGLGADMRQVKDSRRHHFDVIDGLCTPDHALTRCLLS